jgi:hypothetical protein
MAANSLKISAGERPAVSMVETMARAGKFVEAGAALRAIDGQLPARSRAEHFDVIVIGGGQAGLSVGFHLKRQGLRFVILDASARIGDAWRSRWDSLRRFTPRRYCGLDGMRFPAVAGHFRPRTRWLTSCMRMRRSSTCRCEAGFVSMQSGVRVIATSSKLVNGGWKRRTW